MTFITKPGGKESSRSFFSCAAMGREGWTSWCPPRPELGAGPWYLEAALIPGHPSLWQGNWDKHGASSRKDENDRKD